MPKIPRTGQTWVLKKAEVIVFPEPREVPVIGVGQRGKNSFLNSSKGRHWMVVWDALGRSYCAGQLGWVEEEKGPGEKSWRRVRTQQEKQLSGPCTA